MAAAAAVVVVAAAAATAGGLGRFSRKKKKKFCKCAELSKRLSFIHSSLHSMNQLLCSALLCFRARFGNSLPPAVVGVAGVRSKTRDGDGWTGRWNSGQVACGTAISFGYLAGPVCLSVGLYTYISKD